MIIEDHLSADRRQMKDGNNEVKEDQIKTTNIHKPTIGKIWNRESR